MEYREQAIMALWHYFITINVFISHQTAIGKAMTYRGVNIFNRTIDNRTRLRSNLSFFIIFFFETEFSRFDISFSHENERNMPKEMFWNLNQWKSNLKLDRKSHAWILNEQRNEQTVFHLILIYFLKSLFSVYFLLLQIIIYLLTMNMFCIYKYNLCSNK